ncbi:MAG: HEAT repeat domain-containing protein [Planctomycetes bacterium]|nr:HEAT repeat domain-containing protein [Planctomycetota bacterium]
MSRFRQAILLFFVLSVILFADAEIYVPPGTTDEIITGFIPTVKVTDQDRVILTGLGPETKKKEEPKKTAVVKKLPPILPPKAPPPFNVSFEELLGVASADFDIEYADVASIRMGADPVTAKITYKATDYDVIKAKCDVYFKCFTRVLMRLFHNNRMLDREDTYYLTLFGDPAGSFPASNEVLNNWDNIVGPFCKNALAYIDPETQEPKLDELADPYENMVNKLVFYEILMYSPFTVSVPFAPSLDNFSTDEIYRYIKVLSTHPNKRVRRNAIYYLGMMQKYEPLDDLFRVLRNTADKVEKCRALFFLTQANFDGLVDYLLEQVAKEGDPIFEVAMLNSLRKMRDIKAFPVLVEKLCNARSDFEYYFAVLKACIACLDKSDKKVFQRFVDKCNELRASLREQEFIRDPPLPRQKYAQPPPTYQAASRFNALDQVLELGLAICGDYSCDKKIVETLKTSQASFSKFTGEVAWALELALRRWSVLTRIFVVEELPQLGEDGKTFLHKLLTSGYEHDYVLFNALDVYARAYPKDFSRLAFEILESDVRVTIKDRTIKALYYTSSYDKRGKKALLEIANTYNPSLSDENKHLISIAVFYLAREKLIKDKALIPIIESEFTRTLRNPKFSQDMGIFYIRFPRTNNLLEVALEALGSLKTPKAEKAMLKLVDDKTNEIHIKRLVVKTLCNFSSKGVREKLFQLLTDPDPWTRLIAYLSLGRITRVDHRIDWFFQEPSALTAQVEEYKKKIVEYEKLSSKK